MTKPNRTLLIGTVILVAAGLMFTAGCKGKSLSEKIAEKAIEKATGGKAHIDTKGESIKVKTDEGEVSYGAANKWPEDIPEDVPKFEAGKFAAASKMSTESGASWTMAIGDVDATAVADYVQALKDSGWTEGVSSDSEKAYHFQVQKDKYAIVLIYDKEGKQLGYTFVLNN